MQSPDTRPNFDFEADLEELDRNCVQKNKLEEFESENTFKLNIKSISTVKQIEVVPTSDSTENIFEIALGVFLKVCN